MACIYQGVLPYSYFQDMYLGNTRVYPTHSFCSSMDDGRGTSEKNTDCCR